MRNLLASVSTRGSLGILIVFLWGLVSPLGAEAPIPPLQNPVSDQANVLSESVEGFLNAKLQDLRAQGGSQIAILTVPTLGTETIEQFSIRVAEAWKLGDAERDNGVLLLLAIGDRRARIEVGQGLEGQLTDAYTNRIIREHMTPLFREGRYDAGVVAGVSLIVSHTDPDFRMGVETVAKRSTSKRSASLGELLFFLFFLLFGVIFGGRRSSFHRGRRGFGGGFGGGGFGGGGFGGGGFGGGGGGGFSGGGASGQW